MSAQNPAQGAGELGGSWDLVSKVISTLIRVISIVTLIITLATKSHDPLSRTFRSQGVGFGEGFDELWFRIWGFGFILQGFGSGQGYALGFRV